MALDLFAGIPVSDYEAAKSWYERLLGAEPSFVGHATESVWELAEHRFLFILEDAERAGRASTPLCRRPRARVANIASRGIEPDERSLIQERRARRSIATPMAMRSASAAPTTLARVRPHRFGQLRVLRERAPDSGGATRVAGGLYRPPPRTIRSRRWKRSRTAIRETATWTAATRLLRCSTRSITCRPTSTSTTAARVRPLTRAARRQRQRSTAGCRCEAARELGWAWRLGGGE